MADGDGAFNRNHSFSWNFSILEGVMVKVNDKFRPPKQVHLPIGWRSIEYEKDVEFDFKLEEDVIKMAIEEQLQEERRKEQSSLAPKSMTLEEESEGESDINACSKEDQEPQTGEDGTPISFHTDVNDVPILEPMRINSEPLAKRTNVKSSKDFNFSEFEDNCATPFELVELQTLDDIDELKSVLQPGCRSNQPRKGKRRDKDDSEIDFSIFDGPVIANQDPSEVGSRQIATASLIPDIEPVQSTVAGRSRPQLLFKYEKTCDEMIAVSTHPPASLQQDQPFESLPVSSRSGNLHSFSYGQTFASPHFTGSFSEPAFKGFSLPFGSHFPMVLHSSTGQTKSDRLLQGPASNSRLSDGGFRESNHFGNYMDGGRDKAPFQNSNGGHTVEVQARGNLNKTNSRSLPNLVTVGMMAEDDVSQESQSYPQEPIVSTSRIDNIMRQFQLNRLKEFKNISAHNEVSSKTDVSLKDDTESLTKQQPAHGILTSQQALSRSIPFSAASGSNSLMYVGELEKSSLSDDESRMRFPPLQETNPKRKLSSSEPLPPIATPTSPRTPVSMPVSASFKQHSTRHASWLPDPTPGLSPEESSLAGMIIGMGFAGARTARAVQRLKSNQKEIIDFLLQVQEIADLGFDADDVEMAIINSSDEKEKILNYLRHTSKWKELGFPIQRVHDALLNTDLDNEAVFEYLTR